MAKAIPVNLPSIQFKKKKDAEDFFRSIRDRYLNGVTIAGMDFQYLWELLQFHPDAEEKIGVGVRRFYCDKSDEGTRCFFIERINGTDIDFSYQWIIRCIK